MKIASIIARYLLGLIFLVFGMNHYLNFIPTGPMPAGVAGQYFGILMTTHYLYVVAFFEVVPAILLLYALPLLWLLMKSFLGPDGITVRPYIEFFGDPFNWRVVWNTLGIALYVTLFCLVIGYPAAFALAPSSTNAGKVTSGNSR